ncbi:MAG: hypothetical protein V7638_2654, partial [Acidobacteriota bacterium]
TAFKMVMICVSLNLLFRIRPPGFILARKPLLFNGPVFGEGYIWIGKIATIEMRNPRM